MRLIELIGKEITDISVTTQQVDKFLGLWKADCYIVLQDGLIIGIPFNFDNEELDKEEVWIRALNNSAISYYRRKWWQRKVDAFDDLRGKRISDIIYYPVSEDKALVELDNGKIITEVTVAPIGIAVGLYVYNSIDQAEKRFGQDYLRLTGWKGSA
jgi:hypothetical protein